jgi:acyl-CoA thioesterase
MPLSSHDVGHHQRPTALLSAPGLGTATFPRHWWSFSGALGGAVAATMLDAAAGITDPARLPRQASFYFHRPVDDQELVLAATTIREGRATSAVSVTATAAGRLAVQATVLSAVAEARPEATLAPAFPRVPRSEDCQPLDLPPELVPFARHYEFRFIGEARPHAHSRAELLAWVSPRAGGPLDPRALAVIADAMPPALFATSAGPIPLPTTELSLVLTAHPATEGPVLVRMATRSLSQTWCVDDCDIWSHHGQLLAQARQSRLVMDPEALGLADAAIS